MPHFELDLAFDGAVGYIAVVERLLLLLWMCEASILVGNKAVGHPRIPSLALRPPPSYLRLGTTMTEANPMIPGDSPDSILQNPNKYGPDLQAMDLANKFNDNYGRFKVALQELENARNALKAISNTWPRTVDYVLLPTNPSSKNLDLTVNQIQERQQWGLRQINDMYNAVEMVKRERLPLAPRSIEFMTEWVKFWKVSGKTSSEEPGEPDWKWMVPHIAPTLLHNKVHDPNFGREVYVPQSDFLFLIFLFVYKSRRAPALRSQA
uniref:Uncharacterized protein n=1 Tax=Chromera velia CCMP2878 TaxID=1169474 RepID=A0A0G4F5V0_9ALVE|eukprot:Cvel_15178.t1-p1 / transcript=Cvel_15178.t1 / gene=Cvel_15178 / organism=Chromera_velia_CCMP2878 / gene_product=hypothetical protein / transcript_product=hypothetical protein / location=Cvel_scaffold1109:35616-49537(+) / protein_length=264 / sequence_SO=supercontig / SO=protein_coding / is_pseudo=false